MFGSPYVNVQKVNLDSGQRVPFGLRQLHGLVLGLRLFLLPLLFFGLELLGLLLGLLLVELPRGASLSTKPWAIVMMFLTSIFVSVSFFERTTLRFLLSKTANSGAFPSS